MQEQSTIESKPVRTRGTWTADGEMVFAAIGEATYAKRVADCSPNECEDEPEQAFADGEPEANAEYIALAVNSHAALVEALQEWHRLSVLRGLDPILRNKLKRHAHNLTRNALRAARAELLSRHPE